MPASTDMGNVSHIIPSIHPGFAIGTKEVNHTKKFNEATNTPKAHAQTLLNGKAMAYTCIDVLWTDGALEEVKKTFAESIGSQPHKTQANATETNDTNTRVDPLK